MLNGLDLFSGIGGIGVALGEWVRTVAYCERDRYAQSVLLSRMLSRDIDRAPIWDDVTSLRGSMLPNIDIIFGGFPCQDISSAGSGIGLGGERSGLFFHIARLVEETNPRFVFLENVAAIRTRGLNSVAQTFTELGYDFRWTIVSAKEVGACHVRKRWFGFASNNLLRGSDFARDFQKTPRKKSESRNKYGDFSQDASDANNQQLRVEPRWSRRGGGQVAFIDRIDGSPRTYSNFNGARLEGQYWSEPRIRRPASYNGWKSQPTICRGSDGVPYRVDRIKGLGNSVVPLQAREAFMRLSGLK